MPRKQETSLTRQAALDATPVAAPIARREPLPAGGARLSVMLPTPNWQRWLLRVPDHIARKFDLDAPGLEVLDLCDGSRSVTQITERFAQAHRLDPHEARSAVARFLRTLIGRGLVTMVVPRPPAEPEPPSPAT